MGKQIIKQTNGRYAIWSSTVDNFVCYDCIREELIEEFVEEARRDIEKNVDGVLEKLRYGKRPYYQFTKTLEEAIEKVRIIHGVREASKVEKLLCGKEIRNLKREGEEK